MRSALIHDIIKIKYVEEGYITKNYPPHLISDKEMMDGFLKYTRENALTSNIAPTHIKTLQSPNISVLDSDEVVFYGRGGYWGRESTLTLTIDSDGYVTIPYIPYYYGYTLNYWQGIDGSILQPTDLYFQPTCNEYYAMWQYQGQIVSVYFYGNGGYWGQTGTLHTVVDSRGGCTSMSAPSRSRYTCVGYLGADGSFVGLSEYFYPTCDCYYAVWVSSSNTPSSQTFTVMFFGNGGFWGTDRYLYITTNEQGYIEQMPSIPDRDSFTFVEWLGTDDSVVSADTVSFKPSATVYVAQWEYIYPYIVFHSNGGYWEGSIIEIGNYTDNNGFVFTPTENPINEGYVFLGYKGSDDTIIDASTTVFQPTCLNYYALWSYDYITFDGNGGTWNGNTTVINEVDSSGYVSTPDIPERDKYKFTGWLGDDGSFIGVDTASFVPTSNTYYAQWELEITTVYFYGNGGYWGQTGTVQISVNSDGYVSLPSNPSRSGYVLDYWLGEDGTSVPTSVVTFIPTCTAYYAQWKKEHEYVVFDGNGGTWGSDTTLTIYTDDDAYVTILALPEREGYSIYAWLGEDGTTISSDTVRFRPTCDLYTAQWNKEADDPTVSVRGYKTWLNDTEDIRPNYITIHLYADGTEIETKNVTKDDGWFWNFTNLKKYNDDRTRIEYTISEDTVENYKTTIDEYDVINSYTIAESTPRNPEKTATCGDIDLYVGKTVTYEISYYNYNDTTTKVIIKDVLDIGVDYLLSSDNGIYTEDTREVLWEIDAQPFENGYVVVTVKVNKDSKQLAYIENTASVQIGNDSAIDTNTVKHYIQSDNPINPTKEVDVGDNTVVNVGDIITYTIKCYNHTNQTATINILDYIDVGIDLISWSASADVYQVLTTDEYIQFTLQNCNPFSYYTVTITAKVNNIAQDNLIITNSAEVQIGSEDIQYTGTITNTLLEPISPEYMRLVFDKGYYMDNYVEPMLKQFSSLNVDEMTEDEFTVLSSMWNVGRYIASLFEEYFIGIKNGTVERNIEKVFPDWVYSYMVGSAIGNKSSIEDKHDLLVLLDDDNLNDVFTIDAAADCYDISKKWIKKLTSDRPATCFGEGHVIKSLRLDNII